MWSPLRKPEAPSAVWRTERRASTRDGAAGSLRVSGQPSRPAARLEREDGAEAAVDERDVQSPFLEQLRHQVHSVALADAAEIDLHAAFRRAHQERIRVELERRQPGADRDVERAGRQLEHVARDHEALQRRRADLCALARRQMVDARDVAVGQEAAQLPLEAVRPGRRPPAPPVPRTRSSGCTAYTSKTVAIASCEKRRTSPSSRGLSMARPPSASVRGLGACLSAASGT